MPARTVLAGRQVRLDPLDPNAHAEALFEAAHAAPVDPDLWSTPLRTVRRRSRDAGLFTVDGEWLRLKAVFEAWLDPVNFDADGRQRRRLEALRAQH